MKEKIGKRIIDKQHTFFIIQLIDLKMLLNKLINFSKMNAQDVSKC